MPPISLVVCLHKEADYLRRLLSESQDCHDDLVVVHDGPDTTNVRTVVEAAHGRFFEGRREHQQEPHWPRAWAEARHDWILRLDADEMPGAEMKQWLQAFRRRPEPPGELSGYTCIWPMWNGRRAVSRKWPAGRNFLFHRNRVRFFGMAEQAPIPDGRCEALDFVLRHEPVNRQTHSLRNLLCRKTAYRWRERIGQSLLGKPTDLACWRWQDENWPLAWDQIRRQPLWTAIKRMIKGPLLALREQWRAERRFYPLSAVGGPLNLALVCFQFWWLRRSGRRPATPAPRP